MLIAALSAVHLNISPMDIRAGAEAILGVTSTCDWDGWWPSWYAFAQLELLRTRIIPSVFAVMSWVYFFTVSPVSGPHNPDRMDTILQPWGALLTGSPKAEPSTCAWSPGSRVLKETWSPNSCKLSCVLLLLKLIGTKRAPIHNVLEVFLPLHLECSFGSLSPRIFLLSPRTSLQNCKTP